MEVGDVIYIEANSGAVKRQGRSDAFATEFDLEAEEYVPLPKGDVHKKKEVVQVCCTVTKNVFVSETTSNTKTLFLTVYQKKRMRCDFLTNCRM